MSGIITMKNSRAKNMLGLGSVLALAISIGSSAFAGPSPQYWQQMERIRAENAAKRAVASANTAKPGAMVCDKCKTTPVTEYRPSQAGGKVPARFDRVGTKHTCDGCGGAITSVRGKTTNDMKANCPTCAPAGPGCCSA
jgi:hypothetical protein